jgi:DNA replication and repair protein RecF
MATRFVRLTLTEFRSYAALDLACSSALVALAGDNGAGKTNVLEALSLLSPGRGLRRADLAAIARQGGSGGFAVAVEAEGALGPVHLGTGLAPGDVGSRRCRIDREPVASATAFTDHLRLLWLTPESDGLFRGPAGDRRRFLDRLVLAIDAGHGARVSALEKALRSRNRLLEADRPDAAWLDAVEREVAEVAVAVAAARRDCVLRLAELIAATRDSFAPFPWADIAIAGDLEMALGTTSAIAVEDWYRGELAAGRWRDKAAGRALIGPNTSDLVVRHGPKGMPAEVSSTGEQKALLIGLVLAHSRLVRAMSGMPPILLLDEVAAHLDPRRRAALYRLLPALGGQVWMTGTDAALFTDLSADGRIFAVSDGQVRPA